MPRTEAGFDLVIFDCDGVLIDSETIASRAVAAALRAVGLDLAAEVISERFVGMSNKDMIALLEADFGGPLPAQFEAAIEREASVIFERELRPVAGIEAVLAALAIKKCVASSTVPERLAYKLGLTGLTRWFGEGVFSTTMVTRGKPAPDIFLYAAARMGVAPCQVLVIEDSVPGVLAAKAAGMTASGFTGGSHCRPDHAARLTAAGADLVFAKMQDLPHLMTQSRW